MVKAKELDFGHGVVLECSVPEMGRLHVALTVHGYTLVDRVVDHAEKLPLQKKILDEFEVDGCLEIDTYNGEARWSGRFLVHEFWRVHEPWQTVFSDERTILLRFDPTIGSIGGSEQVNEPTVTGDPTFGPSQLCTPVILRLHVEDGDPRAISKVGTIVKQMMFPGYPPFIYNTVACTGNADPDQRGAYTDPRSPWFNVFMGFYQVDCDKSLWTHPFGYESANGVKSVPKVEDVVRLGKSDWNWFSNWMYGVPEDALQPYNAIDMGAIGVGIQPVAAGSRMWHEVTLSGVEVASCYQSDDPGAGRLVENSILTGVWRDSFGLPNPRPEFTQSFCPTVMDAVFDMAYWEDGTMFHTVIFGGTTNNDGRAPGLVKAEVDAIKSLIENAYANLGFSA